MSEVYERRFYSYVKENMMEDAISIYIQGLLNGIKFNRHFHLIVRKILSDVRDPYLSLKFYNDLLNAKIKFGNSIDGTAAKIDNALKKFSPYTVNLAYQTLKKNSKIHNLIYREVVDKLSTEFRLVQHALRCYYDMRLEEYSPDLWTYNRLLNCICRSDDYDTAWKIIEEMIQAGVKPDIVTCNILLNYQIIRKRWDQVVNILDMIVNARLLPSKSTINTLMNNKFFNRLKVEETQDFAKVVIQRMSHFQQLEWFAKRGDKINLIKVYEKMINSGMNMELRTFEIIIQYYFSSGNGRNVIRIYKEIIRLGIKPNLNFYNVLIEGFVKMEDMNTAKSLYHYMLSKSIIGNIDTYSHLLLGYSRISNLQEIDNLLKDMILFKIDQNIFTISILLNLFIKLKNVSIARQVYDKLFKVKYLKPDAFIVNCLVHGYTYVSKNLTEATEFLLCQQRKVQLRAPTFNIIIRAYVFQDDMDSAINLMKKMEPLCGVEPNSWTFYYLITGYIRREQFDKALELLNEIQNRNR
ncbi:10595_t:CDS:2 [Diversispora eburnea]|uniref:10595_t:CDS:1 n=1 Tax=Diversispora eburnea TaxID=1213867 RepID=A0A9N8WRZ9_9GLOM|nr:10595_t:CDS:2 [Diversispora eburnea]